MKRRSFIRNAGAALAGGLLLSQTRAFGLTGNAGHSIGIQLFTVMKEIDQDLNGTLKKIADLGFKDIESAFSMKGGFYGLKPKEFATVLKDLGLSWRSHHVLGAPFVPPPGMKLPESFSKMATLKDSHQKIVDEVAEGGVEYLVCANTPIKTGDEVKQSLEVLIKSGEAAKKAGVTLAFHNHDAEFKAVDGVVPYDLFLSQASADLLKFELDLAWVTKAGVDPIELFKKNPGRFPLWHAKDFDKDFKQLMPVGQGVVDFKRIFAAADTAGMKYFFVEHDMPANPIESITASVQYIRDVIKP